MDAAAELESLVVISDVEADLVQSDAEVGKGHPHRRCATAARIILLAAGILAIVLTLGFTINTNPGGEARGPQSSGDPFANVIQEYVAISPMMQPSCEDVLEQNGFSQVQSPVTYRCDHGSLMAKPNTPHAKEIHVYPAQFDTASTSFHKKFKDPSDMKTLFEGLAVEGCRDFAAIPKKCAKAASEAVQNALGDSACKDFQDTKCHWKIAGAVDHQVSAVLEEMDLDLDTDLLDVMANHFCLLEIEKVQTVSQGLAMLPRQVAENMVKHLRDIPAMIAKGAEVLEKRMCAKTAPPAATPPPPAPATAPPPAHK